MATARIGIGIELSGFPRCGRVWVMNEDRITAEDVVSAGASDARELTSRRPSVFGGKCTPAMVKAFEKMRKSGVAVPAACKSVGIQVATYYNWMKRGREAQEWCDANGLEEPVKDRRYWEFWLACRDARERGLNEAAETIRDLSVNAGSESIRRLAAKDMLELDEGWREVKRLEEEVNSLTVPNYIRPFPKQYEILYYLDHNEDVHGVLAAGRRFGKTHLSSYVATNRMVELGHKVLYIAPTDDQTKLFWKYVLEQMAPLIESEKCTVNKSDREIKMVEGKGELLTRTAWHADHLRGESGDTIILDEYQSQSELLWGEVVFPMLIDNGGQALIIMTPPSAKMKETKAKDPRHAIKSVKEWDSKPEDYHRFHGTSWDNPHNDVKRLEQSKRVMGDVEYRIEIMAEFIEDYDRHALWKPEWIEHRAPAGEFDRIAIGVDPSGTVTGDDTGIVVVGEYADGSLHVLLDETVRGATPDLWSARIQYCVNLYRRFDPVVVAEVNFGGDMVKHTIESEVDCPVEVMRASRGKRRRADPIAKRYAKGEVWHSPGLEDLESQMLTWTKADEDRPGAPSPDRMDAMVWAATWLTERKRDEVVFL